MTACYTPRTMRERWIAFRNYVGWWINWWSVPPRWIFLMLAVAVLIVATYQPQCFRSPDAP